MIGNITRGSGFGGLASYLLQGDRGEPDLTRAVWTVAENLPSEDPELAATVMRATAEQNERGIGQPVWHLSLSWHPDDHPSQEQMIDATREVLNRLGLREHQALIVAHRDTSHPHVHVMVNRVHPETLEVWKGWKDKTRVEQALRTVERENGFREVPGRLARLPGQERPDPSRGLTHGEHQQSRREGQDAWTERMREALQPHFREAKNWAQLEHRLAGQGVRLEKRGRGLVVTDGERQVKASRIDRQGSIHQLEKRFEMPFKEWRGRVEEITNAVGRREAIASRNSRLLHLWARANSRVREVYEITEDHRKLGVTRQNERFRLEWQFRYIYRISDLEPALRRFDEVYRHQGARIAADTLRSRPQTFGRLAGRGFGPFKDLARKESQKLLSPAVKTVHDLAKLDQQILAGKPRFEIAERTLRLFRRRAGRFSDARRELGADRRLPALDNAIARIGLRLGAEAVRLALPPPVAGVVFAAVKVLRMAREAERGMELGR